MSNEPKAGPGLDPELLAAYIDQRLSPEQRAAVEAQLAADPDLHAVLIETMKALDGQSVPKVPVVPVVPKGRVPRVRWAIAGGLLAAAAAAVALVVWTQPDLLPRLRGDEVDPRIERLVAAVGTERYLEARLSGGFRHAPLRPTTRGSGDLGKPNPSLLAVAGELQRQAQLKPDIDNLHAWGVAQLLLGEHDAAVATLEKAGGLSSDSALLSDLAAAYLGSSIATGDPARLASALDAARRAADAAPNSAPALFNLALALELSGDLQQSRSVWERLLRAETDAAWANEARQRLEAMGRR